MYNYTYLDHRLLEKYAHHLDDKRKDAKFLEKLDDRLRPYLQVVRNSSFEDILTTTIAVERSLPRSSSSSSSAKKDDRKRKAHEGKQQTQFLLGIFCHYCNREGHRQQDCRKKKWDAENGRLRQKGPQQNFRNQSQQYRPHQQQ